MVVVVVSVIVVDCSVASVSIVVNVVLKFVVTFPVILVAVLVGVPAVVSIGFMRVAEFVILSTAYVVVVTIDWGKSVVVVV